ncbi:Uncharacterised protein [Mycobacteroides abscessus subsp. abscessus]|nr:Uncharacterised protein [Mycobacteroides abscessus subsp. abscessus]
MTSTAYMVSPSAAIRTQCVVPAGIESIPRWITAAAGTAAAGATNCLARSPERST